MAEKVDFKKMNIQFLGHSCFLIETGGKRLLFDPFISGNELAKGIEVRSIRADYIFLSHAHDDHAGDVELIAAENPDVLIVSNWEVAEHFGKKGLRWHPMNIGGEWAFDFGRVKMVAAVHSSSFAGEPRIYGGNPGGFLIDTGAAGGSIYFAGDTALTWDMKLIPMFWPALDAAILPIGSNFTMSFSDAVLASDFVGCDRVIGCHFDTFGYIKIDHAAAEKAFFDRGKELILMPIGGTLKLD